MEYQKLPKGKNSEDAKRRREIIESTLKLKLKNITAGSLTAEDASKNIENFIGTVQVPLGVVGPLLVNGEHANGHFYVPLATTEGALLATINRGCSVITESGGADVMVVKNEMTRAPVFKVNGIKHGALVSQWISSNMELLKKETRTVSKHTELLEAVPYLCGRTLFVRFSFGTGDAMGMNMATIASQKLCEVIEKETGAKTVSVSGNMCTDKKPAAINYILGRGKSMLAEVQIPEKIAVERLHATSEEISDTAYRKNLLGSAMSLSMGFNSHFANMAAALFIATGQDAAQTVEASLGISTVERTETGLYVSVRIPSLEVGTVGGGTSLPCQSEALEIMGCKGQGNALKFTEIAAAVILAGEISTLAAQAKGELASAHEKLAR
jgi:hydroxymethylglutaryl-CoA reductase (NADPH)